MRALARERSRDEELARTIATRTASLIRPKRMSNVGKVSKSAQVNTLASQATKDVASCDKPGGAANKR